MVAPAASLSICSVWSVPSRRIDYKPFDLPAAHIFKIQGGLIREIEALGFLAPYNAPTGW